jgi:RHS repeat-associated protein
MQGNDYFGARYFGSSQGRFTAPDWSEKPEPVPYADLADPQTLNLYGYVRNNPMGRADADGHCCEEVAELGEELSAVPSPATKVLGGILIGVGLIGTAVSTPEGRRAITGAVDDIVAAVQNMPAGVGLTAGFATSMMQKSPPNPNGQQGAPDHQAEVQNQTDKAQGEAKPGQTVVQGKKIQGVDSTRRPDVQVVGPDGKVVKVVEVERRPNSQRHVERQKEYDSLGVPHKTVPLPKKRPGEN